MIYLKLEANLDIMLKIWYNKVKWLERGRNLMKFKMAILSMILAFSLVDSFSCVNAGNIYDDYNFNEGGINKVTGTEYDEHGFDRNGIHKETNKEYDRYGFKRDGINILTKNKYSKSGYYINGIDRQGYDRYHNFYGSL